MKNKRIPVILDTDIGGDIDDTWALAMLLGCPELDLKMVVTEDGDTTYRARIAAKFLELCGRTDVPVAVGVAKPQDAHFNQQPWVEGYRLRDYPGVVHEDGVQAMIDLIMVSPEPVTIIAIGVVTNLARALEIEPRIAQRCKFVGMHGSIYVGYGGSSDISAEANVINDVPSFRKVIAAPWLDTLITPLDTCGLVVLTGDHYQKIYQSDLPKLRAVIENFEIWAKLVQWAVIENTDQQSSCLFDTVAVYLAYAEDLVEIEEVSISTTDDGFTVINPGGAKVRAAVRWKDLDAFYDHLVERLLVV
jgi:inosine-uridine nucleoside N-ribohydrolase